MVNHHLWACECEHLITKGTNAFGIVEIGTNHQICTLQIGICLCFLSIIQDNRLCTWHPSKKIGKSVGYDNLRLFAERLDKMIHCQTTSHSIAIWRLMGKDRHFMSILNIRTNRYHTQFNMFQQFTLSIIIRGCYIPLAHRDRLLRNHPCTKDLPHHDSANDESLV